MAAPTASDIKLPVFIDCGKILWKDKINFIYANDICEDKQGSLYVNLPNRESVKLLNNDRKMDVNPLLVNIVSHGWTYSALGELIVWVDNNGDLWTHTGVGSGFVDIFNKDMLGVGEIIWSSGRINLFYSDNGKIIIAKNSQNHENKGCIDLHENDSIFTRMQNAYKGFKSWFGH